MVLITYAWGLVSMKIVVVCFLLFSLSLKATDLGELFHQAKNLKKAMKLAKDENKFLFVYLSLKGCPSCKKMESEVFVQLEVIQKLNQNFQSTHFEINSDAGQEITKQYRTIGAPALLFFSPDGELLYTVGSLSAAQLLERLEFISDDKWSKMLALYQQVPDPSSLERSFIAEMLEHYSGIAKKEDRLLQELLQLYFYTAIEGGRSDQLITASDYRLIRKIVGSDIFHPLFMFHFEKRDEFAQVLEDERFSAKQIAGFLLKSFETWTKSYLVQANFLQWDQKRFSAYKQQAKVFVDQSFYPGPDFQSWLAQIYQNNGFLLIEKLKTAAEYEQTLKNLQANQASLRTAFAPLVSYAEWNLWLSNVGLYRQQIETNCDELLLNLPENKAEIISERIQKN